MNGKSGFVESAVIYSEADSLIRLDMGLLKAASVVRNLRITYLRTEIRIRNLPNTKNL
jgi:hypothetical protein